MEGFEAHTLAFKTVVTSKLRLPPFKGSTLRGAFTGALVGNFCVNPHRKSCRPCATYRDCPICYLVATLDPENARGADVPRPYIVQPPLDLRTEYGVGEALEFNVVVFGRALALLPYVVIAVQRMGQMGIGARVPVHDGRPARGTFAIREIWALNAVTGISQRIHEASDGLVKVPSVPVVHHQVLERAEEMMPRLGRGDVQLTLRLLTPLRLVEGAHLVRRLTFRALFLRLVERLEALSGAYGDTRLELDVPHLLDEAEQVQVAADATRWLDVERYSARQERRLPMGGLVGEVTFHGQLQPFLPWLIWGMQVGVGKYAVAGCGRYELGDGCRVANRRGRGERRGGIEEGTTKAHEATPRV